MRILRLLGLGEETEHWQLQHVHKQRRHKTSAIALERLSRINPTPLESHCIPASEPPYCSRFLVGSQAEKTRAALVKTKEFKKLCILASYPATRSASNEATEGGSEQIDESEAKVSIQVQITLGQTLFWKEAATLNKRIHRRRGHLQCCRLYHKI